MHSLFGITFILYLRKLSAGKGFWKNFRIVNYSSMSNCSTQYIYTFNKYFREKEAISFETVTAQLL